MNNSPLILDSVPVKLTNNEQELIKFVLTNSFPWFFQGCGDSGDDFILTENYWGHNFYAHNLMIRDVLLDKEVVAKEGIINSPHADGFINMFKRFADNNGLDVNNVCRAALNHTVYSSDIEDGSHFHIDHNFPHKVFIMALTDFTDGQTIVKDENDKLHYLTHKKYQASVFDGKYNHRQLFCNKGERRIMFLLTFN